MSVKCQTWVWDHSPTTGNDRIVLLFLADQADDDGTDAFPSIDRITTKSNLPKRTVMRCIARLEAMGAILVHRPQHRGRGRFNTYEVVMKGDTLTCVQPPDSPLDSPQEMVPEGRVKARKGAPPYLNRPRSLDPLTHRPCPQDPAPALDESSDLRAGGFTNGQDPQEPPADPGRHLLDAVAAAAPPACRYELLEDPDQAAGRSALRRRLALIAAAVGPDAAVTAVAGEWPMSVVSAMAHANARARSFLEGAAQRFAEGRSDPLDGIAAATAARAEEARARAEADADKPRVVPSAAEIDQLRRQLQGERVEADA